MADLGGVFDSGAPENQPVKSVLPAGEYEMIAIASERKRTADGTGEYLNCQFQVVSGEQQNRMLFHKFNLWLTPSDTDREKAERTQKAINIARGQFSEFCRAASVPSPSKSEQLHNIPVIVRVTTKDSPGYGLQNNVQGFKAKVKTSAAPVVTAVSNGSDW